MSRAKLAQAFLQTTGWQDAVCETVAGDASNRRYDRLTLKGRTAILMDAPTEKGEDVRPFLSIARHLQSLGFSAPKILAEDIENGFLLLEDLGDDLYARVLAENEDLSSELYSAATDALLDLHNAKVPEGLPPYDVDFMAEMAALAWRWYLRGTDAPYEEKATAFENAFKPVLARYAATADVLIQRDYHAENLLWLPERDGVARVGMLDFQDALVGHRAYDLLSLMQDARRDVPPALERQMLDRYIATSGLNAQEFENAYYVLGVQRNLRIIGVFGRLCMMAGKAHYVDLIPRVWAYLLRDLQHPALGEVAEIIMSDLPKPTPEILSGLKEKCATLPKL